jgi:RND family efflux transporter MFP subunit
MPQQRRSLVVSIITRVVVCVALLAAGFGIVAVLYGTRPQPPAQRPDSLLPRLLVFESFLAEVRREWVGYASARAVESVDVPAQVAAIVSHIPADVDDGRPVRAGQVLAELDPADFEERLAVIVNQLNALDADLEALDIEEESWRARLAFAESELEIAQRDLERVRTIFDAGDARQVELDAAQQAVRVAERLVAATREEFDKAAPRRLRLQAQRQGLAAERRIAERDLARCTIVSPIDGIIETVDVNEGEQVGVGRRIARVVDVARIEAPVRLPTSARSLIALGDAAVLRPSGAGSESWHGVVTRVSPEDDPATRTFAAYIEVEQDAADPSRLAPGRFVEATVTSHVAERRTVVPRGALEGDRLLIVQDGVLRAIDVNLAFRVSRTFPDSGVPREPYWAALEQPLPEGTLVVLNGSLEMAPGTRVTAVGAAGGEGAVAGAPREGGAP